MEGLESISELRRFRFLVFLGRRWEREEIRTLVFFGILHLSLERGVGMRAGGGGGHSLHVHDLICAVPGQLPARRDCAHPLVARALSRDDSRSEVFDVLRLASFCARAAGPADRGGRGSCRSGDGEG
jgi:hypothetical protein